MIQLNVKAAFLYLTNQLIQVNQRPSILLPQVVVHCVLNFQITNFSYFFLLFVVLKFKKQLGLPFEGGIELAQFETADYI